MIPLQPRGFVSLRNATIKAKRVIDSSNGGIDSGVRHRRIALREEPS